MCEGNPPPLPEEGTRLATFAELASLRLTEMAINNGSSVAHGATIIQEQAPEEQLPPQEC